MWLIRSLCTIQVGYLWLFSQRRFRMLGLRNIEDMTPVPSDTDAPTWGQQAYTDKEGRRWKMLYVRELLADDRFMDIGV